MSDASKRIGTSQRIRLDIRELMSHVLDSGSDGPCNFSYVIRDGRLSFHDLERGGRAACITVNTNWPATGQRNATGFIWICDEKWDIQYLVIPFTGTLTRAGVWMWRLICPVTKKSVQGLYLDKKTGFFVSRDAFGRRPRTNPARIARIFLEMVQVSNLVGGVCDDWSIQKPEKMSDLAFGLVEKTFELQFYRLHFAGSALPEPCFNADGSMYLERLVRLEKRANH